MAITLFIRARAFTAVASAALMTVGFMSPAHAKVDEPPRPAFYEAPATLPANNGDVIRSEQMTFLLDPGNMTSLWQNSQRIMYRSTNRAGKAIAVSGTVLVPKTRWIGIGSRPVIGYAPGTQGVADRCAPSRQFSEGIEYEGLGIKSLLDRGYAIAMPDYEGLGTAGVHTYMDRISQGRTTLDVIRAAQRLPGTGLSSSSPVGLMGYSQGAGAAASAAELASSYAPELRVKGALLGAVPADLTAVAKKLDGTMFAAFAYYALVGISESYQMDLTPYLNAAGVQKLTEIQNECVFDLFNTSFVRSETLSANGRPMSEIMQQQPFASILEQQRIGKIKPSMPVLVDHSALDDTIPYAQGKAMAKSWCAKGANVNFETNLAPAHIGGMTVHWARALPFFEARFAGLPQISNCWIL